MEVTNRSSASNVIYLPLLFDDLRHLALAALIAIDLLSFEERAFARAFPPFLPPFLPALAR